MKFFLRLPLGKGSVWWVSRGSNLKSFLSLTLTLNLFEYVSGNRSPKAKESILECRHKVMEECHDTYKTEFTPIQEERCTDRYQKDCKIAFNKQLIKAVFKNCHTPMIKSCNDSSQEKATCETHFETSCSTIYKGNEPILDDDFSETK